MSRTDNLLNNGGKLNCELISGLGNFTMVHVSVRKKKKIMIMKVTRSNISIYVAKKSKGTKEKIVARQP